MRRVRRKCETICWHEHVRVIRESQLVRDEARKDRMNARMAVALSGFAIWHDNVVFRSFA